MAFLTRHLHAHYHSYLYILDVHLHELESLYVVS